MNDPIEQFRTAMRQSGLDYAGPITESAPGERPKRFSADGDHQKCCWYVLHLDNVPAGSFGCWKLSFKENWCFKKEGGYSDEEWHQIRQTWKEAAELKEREQEKQHAEAMVRAAKIYEEAEPASIHPYLLAKGIQPHGQLRQLDGVLVLPLRDVEGNLQSLQFIAPDKRYGASGAKRNKDFLWGGKTGGAFFTVSYHPSGPIVICEGFATGASIFEATGYTVLCAMNCGNLKTVAEAVSKRYPRRELLVASDNDQWSEKNVGLVKAKEAAKAANARLVFPSFHNTDSHPTDFNDLHQLQGLQIVKTQIESSEVVKETVEEAVIRLASLTPIEYDRCREKEAKALDIRVSTLDKEVESKQVRSGPGAQGTTLNLGDLEPWEHEVDGAEILHEVALIILKYVVVPEPSADAIALWIAHAYNFDAFVNSPRLNIYSPEKGCGKTTARDVIASLVPRPLPTENLSPAVLFRIIEQKKPTLLADEYDTWLMDNDELRGLLNAGHRRGGQALRCEGDNNEVRAFNVYGPAALCGIGVLPATLHDRSIVIRLKRAKPGEVKSNFDSRHTEQEQVVSRKLVRWCADKRMAIEGSDPVLPSEAFNRVADNWRPLFAIAEIAGGDWPRRAAAAFTALTSKEDSDSEGLGAMLLDDIRRVFGKMECTKVFSQELTDSLCAMEDRPWMEAHKGKKISPSWVAYRLKRFDIKSRDLRIGDSVKKGYELEDFQDAFDRYLPAPGVYSRNNATMPVNTGELSLFQSATENPNVAPPNPIKPTGTIDLSRCCASETAQKQEMEENSVDV